MVFDANAREEDLDLSGHDERSAEVRHFDDSHVFSNLKGRELRARQQERE